VATYGPQAVDSHGVSPTYNAAASGGDRVPPGVLIHVKNTSGSAVTLTINAITVQDSDLATPDRTVNIPATTGAVFVRLLPANVYQDSDGLVGLAWSAVTSVTFAVIS
jgi:hypothetical protein